MRFDSSIEWKSSKNTFMSRKGEQEDIVGSQFMEQDH